MSTSTTTTVASRMSPAQFAVLAGGLVGAIGAAAYISSFFLLSDLSGREAVRSPLCVTANVLITIGFATLALALPALGRLPRWPLLTSAVGCLFVAAVSWASATSGAEFAGMFTDAEWDVRSDSPGALHVVEVVPKMLLCGVGLAALAVTGWRGKLISRGTSVLLGLAALVSLLLMPHPPGALLGGLALAWAARTLRTPEA